MHVKRTRHVTNDQRAGPKDGLLYLLSSCPLPNTFESGRKDSVSSAKG